MFSVAQRFLGLAMGVLPQAVWKCVMLLLGTGTKSIEGLNFFLRHLKAMQLSHSRSIFHYSNGDDFLSHSILYVHFGSCGVLLKLQCTQKKKQTKHQVLVLHHIEMECLVLYLQSCLQPPLQPYLKYGL